MELTATAHDRARSSQYDGERPAVGLGGELPGSPEWMELAATASSRAGLSKRQRRTGREASGASMEASVQTGWAGQRPGGMGGAAGSGVSDMPRSPSSQYGLKAQEDIDPRGIRVTNEPMR